MSTYRGFEIQTTADVLGFYTDAQHSFCFVSGFRRDDDAPQLSMWASVEACKAEIDRMFEDGEA